MNKTNRVRGRIWGIILRLARRRRQFKPSALEPDIPHEVARGNCFRMAQAGYLRTVAAGVRGKPGSEPVYRLNGKADGMAPCTMKYAGWNK